LPNWPEDEQFRDVPGAAGPPCPQAIMLAWEDLRLSKVALQGGVFDKGRATL